MASTNPSECALLHEDAACVLHLGIQTNRDLRTPNLWGWQHPKLQTLRMPCYDAYVPWLLQHPLRSWCHALEGMKQSFAAVAQSEVAGGLEIQVCSTVAVACSPQSERLKITTRGAEHADERRTAIGFATRMIHSRRATRFATAEAVAELGLPFWQLGGLHVACLVCVRPWLAKCNKRTCN